MKKYLSVILIVFLIFTLAACGKGPENSESNTESESQVVDADTEETQQDTMQEDTAQESATEEDSAVEDTTVEDTTVEDTTVEDTTVEDTTVEDTAVEDSSEDDVTEEDTTEKPSGSTETNNNTNNNTNTNTGTNNNTNTSNNGNTTNNNQSTENNTAQGGTETPPVDTDKNDSELAENINNGVLGNATAENMILPEHIIFIGTGDVPEMDGEDTIEAEVAYYELDGNVVNWTAENDLIYVITKGNNRLVVIDSTTMMPVVNIPLAGMPAEMNFVEDKIYISLPDLCRVDVFSKTSYTKITSLYFNHEISSFCIDGDIIYYSEHDQHCDVYKMDMSTNELTQIKDGSHGSYYFPKLYLNKEDNILYIGESRTTGSTLYYYDATTLELKSKFKKNDYGLTNETRELFHMGDEIFWGSYRFSDTEANRIHGKYGTTSGGSVTFVSEDVVSTFEGIFLTETYECIYSNYDNFDGDITFEYILVTESGNIFFRSRYEGNIILGINFNLQ